MNPRILFVTYGGGHAKIIRSLVDRIEALGLPYYCHVLGLTTSQAVLQGCAATVFGFRNLITDQDEDALALGRELSSKTPQSDAVCIEETEAYLGLSFADLINRLGAEEAKRTFDGQGRQGFLPLGPLRRAIDRVKPDLVVATNSPRAEEAAIRVAGERKIPAISIVDLFGGFDIPRIADPSYGTKVCVLSESVKQTFARAGRPPEDIVATGNPAFDGYASERLTDEAAFLQSKVGKKIVLFASQPEPTNPELSLTILNRIASAFASDRAVTIFYRPHPSENFDRASLPEGVVLSTQKDDLAPLLKAAAVTVVISSTVGLEACLLGSTVVALTIPISMETAPYVEEGMALESKTIEDLPSVIKRALAGEKPTGAKLPEVGKAADRVIDVMKELLGH